MSTKGELHYFGPWARMRDGRWEAVPGDGWQEALDRYNAEAPDLHKGRKPRPRPRELTVADLCNRFLTTKKRLLDNGGLSPHTFADHKRITDRLIAYFGKKRLVEDLGADDFEGLRASIAKTAGPVRLGGEIQQTRMVFTYFPQVRRSFSRN
jgi:hypothetical protein